MDTLFLYPGQLAASASPMKIVTILGSCVGVALYDPKKQIGGLCHYLLPEPKGDEKPNPRYGSYAIEKLIDQIVLRGGDASILQAKVYGGASVLGAGVNFSIGEENIKLAEQILNKHKIPILEKIVGGNRGCRIELNTQDFSVVHRYNKVSEDAEEVSMAGVQKQKFSSEVKVLIVDDSATVRQVFNSVLSKSDKIKVVGVAHDAYDAREKIVALEPDVITLDIEMPRMNGVDFLEKLMQYHPMPVIMVSSLSSDGTAAHRALQLGAIEFVHKPEQFNPIVLKDLATSLISKIIAAGSISSEELKKRVLNKTQEISSKTHSIAVEKESYNTYPAIKLICVGGNAGSTDALVKILTTLKKDTPPVVVAISTISTFLQSFIEKHQPLCAVKLQIAQDNIPAFMGHVYFAPANYHIEVKKGLDSNPIIILNSSSVYLSQKPSASKLFGSALEALSSSLCAILLAGFSRDGVDEMLKIREAGGISIVQTPNNVLFSENLIDAIEIGAAEKVLDPEMISDFIYQIRSERLG